MAYAINDILKLDVGEIKHVIRCTENGIHLTRNEVYSQDEKKTEVYFNKQQIRYIYINDDARGSGLMINDRFIRLKEPKEVLRLIVSTLYDKNNTPKMMIQTTRTQADGTSVVFPIYVWKAGIYTLDKFIVASYIMFMETGEGVVKCCLPTNLSSFKLLELAVPDPAGILRVISTALYEKKEEGAPEF